jgi:hypothetical protein
MEPIEYLAKVEPIVVSIFQALTHAERKSADEYRIHSPRLDFYNYKLSQKSGQTDGQIDEQQENYCVKARESNEALLLIDTATAAAAGAILQIAHQCIALAWKKPPRLNKGRFVGSQHLSSVIWNGRNQAMHFEDGKSKMQTKNCLNILQLEFSLDMSDLDSRPRSLAKDIIELLGWYSYEIFSNDMNEMLKCK